MNAAPNPADPSLPAGAPSISAAADRARAQLHEEIERVRLGVEEMLAEQNGADSTPSCSRELERPPRGHPPLRQEARPQDARSSSSARSAEIDDRTERLEQRIDQVEADRQAAEYRIHTDTERMLDGLLQEVRRSPTC